jgi:BTB/POZ domain
MSQPKHIEYVEEKVHVGESYFNVGGDGELYAWESEDQEEKTPLSWRDDPDKTFSDWRLIVVTKSHKPKTYHVHKNVLSTGPRSSKYFARLFSDSKGSSSSNLKLNSVVSNGTSTKIELDDRDAKHFPIMLDFIYADAVVPTLSCNGTAATESSSVLSSSSFQLRSNSSLEEDAILNLGDGIDTMNSTSLRHLSRLLGCDNLTLSINKFIQRDLSFKTGPIYYKNAHEYKDERLAEAAKRLCRDNFEKMSVKSLVRLPIHLMKELLDSLGSFETMSESTSLAASEVVYLYLERNPDLLNPENLLDLTSNLPSIGPEPAIGFTALIRDLDLEPEEALEHWPRLVILCKRCAEAVVCKFGWTDFSVESALNDYLETRRSHADNLLFATSFAAALQKAQLDHSDMVKRQEKFEKMANDMQKALSKKDEQLVEARRQILWLRKKLSPAKQQK